MESLADTIGQTGFKGTPAFMSPEQLKVRTVARQLEAMGFTLYASLVTAVVINAAGVAATTLEDDDVEGFGMVFLEASAAGVPVIGGRSGGVVDAVEDGVSGILVDGTSLDEVAGALGRLLGDGPLRKRMGEAGPRWARRFAWERQAARVRSIAAGEGDPGSDDDPRPAGA